MDLTLTEAAGLLHVSPRTVRAQLADGRLRGYKRDGRWVIPRNALPLTESQRRDLQRKADAMRRALEDALPEAVRAPRSALRLAEVHAFSALAAAIRPLTAADAPAAVVTPWLAALEALAEGHCEFERSAKVAALRRARALLAHGLARAALAADHEAAQRAALDVESEVLPRLAGMLRRVDRLPAAPSVDP